jgi:hypothetical protein
MKNYESEYTQFMRQFLDKHPEEQQQQHINRATWWERKVSLDEQARLDAGQSKATAYVYQSYCRPKA